ncbi:MAG: sensor histidine kinase [Clostridiales bacterium]|nr:sensor histidine kinase [Clostridiales bacterium]
MLTFISVILLPLITLTSVSFKNVSVNYEESIRFTANQSFDQAFELMTYRINSMLKSSDMVCTDKGIQNVLNREQSQTDIFEQNIDLRALNAFLSNVEKSQDVYRVKLYVPGWMMFSTQDINYGNFDEFMKEPEYKLLTDKRRMMLWLKPEKIRNETIFNVYDDTLSLICAIRDMTKLSRIIGVVRIFILEESVREIQARANAIPSAVTYIQNSDGDLISCSNLETFSRYAPGGEVMPLTGGQTLGLEKIDINRNQYLVSAKPLENTDWTLVNVIPYDDIFAKSKEIRNGLIMLTCILGLSSGGLSYLVSRSLTRRVSLLNKSISEVQEGKLDMRVEESGNDEIGLLIKNFNYMLYRIKELLDTQFVLGQEVKNAEFKALQAQINPHFLYNTLELVNWKAIENNVPEIAEILQYMAKFYKISLSGGQDMIPLSTELEHVRMYVQIQKLRFENRIELITDISEQAYGAKTLKLILQPLVENAILHGIFEKREKCGTVKITGRVEMDALVLTVEDNGVGMTEHEVKAVLEKQTPGYGARNIDQRIKLRCGPEYGLTYESHYGDGTKVTVKLSVSLQNIASQASLANQQQFRYITHI